MTALLTADEAARLRVGERLEIVRAGDAEGLMERWYYAPKAWVAGPCPTCGGSGVLWDDMGAKCPDCRDGRRIEPLYTGCRSDRFKPGMRWCPACNDEHGNPTGRVLVGRGSIEVAPEPDGRNWRIVIDCVEVA